MNAASRYFAPAFRGVRDNALPGFVLQLFAFALVLGYFHVGAVGAALDQVGALKERHGYAFSAVSTVVFGAFIPFAFLAATGRIPRAKWRSEFVFLVAFWLWRGVEVDAFYRFQATLFGSTASVRTVLFKMAFDQFVYNPLWVVPVQTFLFLWKDSNYSLAGLKARVRASSMLERMTVVLLSTWAVWTPAVSIVYSLPSPLQLPLCNLVLCFWCLLLSFVSREDAPTTSS